MWRRGGKNLKHNIQTSNVDDGSDESGEEYDVYKLVLMKRNYFYVSLIKIP